MNSIDFSPMAIDDYDKVLELWRGAPGVWVSEADARKRIAFYLERNPGMSFVARDTGRIVGAILGGHDGRRGLLHHLAVAPNCRRRGIGRRLVERSLAALSAAGITRCFAFVLHDNPEGLRFWESIGWQGNPYAVAIIRDIS